ncbi:MAG: efflux RND transporter periplasmic adaptor subunit [Pseudomonadota bacterium]
MLNPLFRRILQVLLPVLFIFGGYLVQQHFMNNPPEARKARPKYSEAAPVEVQSLQLTDFQVVVRSYGMVEPVSRITLVPQVSGVIVEVADSFRSGGRFSEGETLLVIDDSDYQIAVRNARAPLLKARSILIEETARSSQAQADWKSLNGDAEASPLVLRTPQVEAAKAEVLAAEAQLARAQLDLERTRLIAPFTGRVEATRVDLGQFVPAGTDLATLIASDTLQVRLPLNAQQLRYVDFPHANNPDADWPVATLSVGEGANVRNYQAHVVGSEASIDAQTRQLFVIVEVDLTQLENARPAGELEIGQFVQGGVAGRRYEGVFVIPRSLLLPGDEVLLAQDGQIERRNVKVVWRDADNAVLSDGVKTGEKLVITPMRNAITGTRVRYPGSPN